jgi:hypothetical protein
VTAPDRRRDGLREAAAEYREASETFDAADAARLPNTDWRGLQGRVEAARNALHRAALAEAAPPSGALDVERLAEALGNLYEEKWPHVGKPPRVPTTVFGAYAEDIAAEYARLTPESTDDREHARRYQRIMGKPTDDREAGR